VILCPECAARKHGNCDGTAWSVTADRAVPCPCDDPSHEEEAKP
jgi:hypothetical protein